MPEKIAIELADVPKTMLLPLWGRAVETIKENPGLVDKVAVNIINRIDYDFSVMAKNLSDITQYAWIARSRHIDFALRKFLKKNPAGTVVNLGCGMDTTFDRVDNGRLTWYDVDLPEVISLRRNFIEETGRRKFISCSILDGCWLHQLKISGNVFFFAAGVLYYFNKTQVKALLKKLADLFPGGELLFDCASPLGVKVANKKVIESSGMDSSAFLKWGMKKAGEIRAWDDRIQVLSEIPMFRNMKSGLSLKMKYGTFLSDRLKIMSMIHLRF